MALANAALPLAGRIPVNLNYTMPAEVMNSCIRQVVVTNTIPLSAEADAARTERGGKISVLSIAGLIGRAIQSIHEETSVSKLFS